MEEEKISQVIKITPASKRINRQIIVNQLTQISIALSKMNKDLTCIADTLKYTEGLVDAIAEVI